MKLFKVIYIAIFSILFISCSLFDSYEPPLFDGNPQVDKLDFRVQKSSSTVGWTYSVPIEVDLSKYDDIDSIIFVPNLRSETQNKMCIAEMYDFTNELAITKSLVTSTVRYTLHFVRSDNLIDSSLEKGVNNVGLRFRSSEEGHHVEVGLDSHLLIYYK